MKIRSVNHGEFEYKILYRIYRDDYRLMLGKVTVLLYTFRHCFLSVFTLMRIKRTVCGAVSHQRQSYVFEISRATKQRKLHALYT